MCQVKGSLPACPSPQHTEQMAMGRGDSSLALGAEPWGPWESVGSRSLAFSGLEETPFWVGVGGGGISKGLWRSEPPDRGLSIFNLTELLITGRLILYCRQLC